MEDKYVSEFREISRKI